MVFGKPVIDGRVSKDRVNNLPLGVEVIAYFIGLEGDQRRYVLIYAGTGIVAATLYHHGGHYRQQQRQGTDDSQYKLQTERTSYLLHCESYLLYFYLRKPAMYQNLLTILNTK